jgi:hypothetical protein
MHSQFRNVAVLTLALSLPWLACAVGASAEDLRGIRKVMMSTWDKPEARLNVAPVVVVDGHALAGWTQAARGGRALLKRNAHGAWEVTVCAGDGLKEVHMLTMTGMPEATARTLAKDLASAEARLPAATRAKFASFEGVVTMDAAGHHAPGASGAAAHPHAPAASGAKSH